jgi:hypothetical protein
MEMKGILAEIDTEIRRLEQVRAILAGTMVTSQPSSRQPDGRSVDFHPKRARESLPLKKRGGQRSRRRASKRPRLKTEFHQD